MKIGIFISLLIGLHLTFGYVKNRTQQLCFSSPKIIKFKTPTKELWREGKFYFTKDKSSQCKGINGTLTLSFTECKNIKKSGYIETHGFLDIWKINEHEHYYMKFNGSFRNLSPHYIKVREPVVYIDYEKINSGKITHTSKHNSLKNRGINECVRISSFCIMMCVEQFKSMHLLFDEASPKK